METIVELALLDGPCLPWVTNPTPLTVQSFLTGAPPRAQLLTADWTCSCSGKDTLYCTGVSHDSFCLEKQPPMLSHID